MDPLAGTGSQTLQNPPNRSAVMDNGFFPSVSQRLRELSPRLALVWTQLKTFKPDSRIGLPGASPFVHQSGSNENFGKFWTISRDNNIISRDQQWKIGESVSKISLLPLWCTNGDAAGLATLESGLNVFSCVQRSASRGDN